MAWLGITAAIILLALALLDQAFAPPYRRWADQLDLSTLILATMLLGAGVLTAVTAIISGMYATARIHEPEPGASRAQLLAECSSQRLRAALLIAAGAVLILLGVLGFAMSRTPALF